MNVKMSLSKGALLRITQNKRTTNCTVQLLEYKPLCYREQETYRLNISDGQFSTSMSILSTQINHIIPTRKLTQYSLFDITKYTYHKKSLIIEDICMVKNGNKIGKIIGDPKHIPKDQMAF